MRTKDVARTRGEDLVSCNVVCRLDQSNYNRGAAEARGVQTAVGGN